MSRSTTARDTRIAALLRKAANELDPIADSARPAPKAGKANSTPPAAQGGLSCLGCGKAMIANPVCKACAKKGEVKVTSTGTSQRVSRTEAKPTPASATCGHKRCTSTYLGCQQAPRAAAKVAPEAPAKPVGRTAKAHCSTKACTKFGDNATGLCLEHRTAKGVKKAPEGQFITLDDGKRGYRVPAKTVIALRKADLTDAEIIAAAKAKGLGRKVAKAGAGF